MLPELESGGVERGTLELGAYLTGKGHRSLVVSGGGRLVPQLEKEGSRHIQYRHVGEKSPRCLAYLLPLRKLLVRENVDILHMRSRLPAWVGYLAWKTLSLSKRPRLVTTFHGFYSINAYSAIMTRGERVIAISNIIAEHIRQNYPVNPEKIEVIHRGFDTETFNPAKVDSHRLATLRNQWMIKSGDPPLIMLPARLSRWKGHDVFIQSLARIKRLPWSAVCVGDLKENPGYAEQLQATILDLGMADRVRFVGHCGDMAAAFLLADVVVSAASTEPEAFGRVAVEAQAMGKPVVATAHGGSLETVVDRKTGWLVMPNDAASMARALQEAVADRERSRKMGEAGLQWVNQRFTTLSMCKKTVALYDRLLHERNAQMP